MSADLTDYVCVGLMETREAYLTRFTAVSKKVLIPSMNGESLNELHVQHPLRNMRIVRRALPLFMEHSFSIQKELYWIAKRQ